jgi:hypothetical protein
MVEQEMIKVYISPRYDHADHGDGGIRRVVEAEVRHLGQFGVQVVRDVNEADVIQNHGAMMTWRKDTPTVHTGHGLYWSRQPWESGYQQVNAEVVESMCRAQAHTVPSEWVGRAVRRGGLFYPEVVYHGIDAADFEPQKEHGNYVLWNKARADYVSDPNDMQTVAEQMPDVQFLSTIGRKTDNVNVAGTTDYDAGNLRNRDFGGARAGRACGRMGLGRAERDHQAGRNGLPGLSR